MNKKSATKNVNEKSVRKIRDALGWGRVGRTGTRRPQGRDRKRIGWGGQSESVQVVMARGGRRGARSAEGDLREGVPNLGDCHWETVAIEQASSCTRT